MARIAVWLARLAFTAVFIMNMQCALSFCLFPENFASGFQLPMEPIGNSVPSIAAVRGIGVAFIMWNVTYPAFIVSPIKFKPLGWVVLAQQVVGLIGESLILVSIPASGFEVLAGSIMRFIMFDFGGLLLMGAAFAFFLIANGKTRREQA